MLVRITRKKYICNFQTAALKVANTIIQSPFRNCRSLEPDMGFLLASAMHSPKGLLDVFGATLNIGQQPMGQVSSSGRQKVSASFE